MEVHIGGNQIIATTGGRTFHFVLPKDVGLKHETYSIMNHNEVLAEHTIKNEIRQLLLKYKHGNDIHEHGKVRINMLLFKTFLFLTRGKK